MYLCKILRVIEMKYFLLTANLEHHMLKSGFSLSDVKGSYNIFTAFIKLTYTVTTSINLILILLSSFM